MLTLCYSEESVLKGISAAVLITILVTCLSVHAADIPFSASWSKVTKRVNGQAVTIPQYVVYACDKPISKATVSSPVSCDGTLRSYTTSNLWITGDYPATTGRGYVFMNVAARDASGLESPLSKLQVLMYNTMNLPNVPDDFTLGNSCVIIVNEAP